MNTDTSGSANAHYVWFQWMCVKIKGPEMVIDQAFRDLDGFEGKNQIVEHFEDYETLEVKRLT